MNDERAKNRQQFPTIAGVVDQFRREFGPGVRPTYVREGERESGDRAAFDADEAELGKSA